MARPPEDPTSRSLRVISKRIVRLNTRLDALSVRLSDPGILTPSHHISLGRGSPGEDGGPLLAIPGRGDPD